MLTTSDSQWKWWYKKNECSLYDDGERDGEMCLHSSTTAVKIYVHITCIRQETIYKVYTHRTMGWWALSPTRWYIFKTKLKWTTLWHLRQQLMTYVHLSLHFTSIARASCFVYIDGFYRLVFCCCRWIHRIFRYFC